MKKIVVEQKQSKEEKVERKVESKPLAKKETKKKQPNIVGRKKAIYLKMDDFTLEKEENRYVTKKAKRFKASFSDPAKENPSVTIEQEGHPLCMRFLGKKSRLKKVHPIIGRINQNQMTYEEIEQGVDLSYLCQEKGIKESLMIKEKQESYDYEFVMEIGDLTPKFNEKESTLELTKDGKAMYRIMSSYMEDQNHLRSEDCSYEIEEKGTSLLLRLHCDANWINQEARAFPVIVDPTIEVIHDELFQIETLLNGVVDNTLTTFSIGKIHNYPKWFYYALQITVNVDQIRREYRHYSQVELKLITQNMVNDTDDDLYFAMSDGYQLKQWRKSELYDSLILDITSLVQNATTPTVVITLCSGDDGNIEGVSETRTVIKPPVGQILFDSRIDFFVYDAMTELYLPCLVIENELDQEASRMEKQYQAGRGGTTGIQLLNGTYCHEHDDECSIQQGSLSISLSHVFDSLNKQNTFGFGKGWRSNFHQFIQKQKLNEEGNDIVYTDGKGNRHFFYEKWFYKNDQEKIYIPKDKVYLNGQAKLTYRDEDGKEHDIEYECKNEEGLQYVSAASLYNYHQVERVVAKGDLYLSIKNARIKLEKDENRMIIVPHFYHAGTADNREYLPYENIKQSGEGFTDENDKTVNVDYFSCSLSFSDEKINVNVYLNANSNSGKLIPIGTKSVSVQLEQNDILNYLDDVLDVYVNEDLKNVLIRLEAIEQQLSECETNRAILDRQKAYVEICKSNCTDVWNKQDYSGRTPPLPTSAEESAYYHQIEEYDESLQSLNYQLGSLLLNYQNYIFEKERLLSLRQTMIDEQLKKVNDFIMDKEGNTLGFDGYGRLISIQDVHENKIQIEYGDEEENEGKIISIYSDEQTMQFHYDEKTGLLDSMVDTHGKKTKYTYDAAQNLVFIQYSDGQETKFAYEDGFYVESPRLEIIKVIEGKEKELQVQMYYYAKKINQDTMIENNQDVTLFSNERYFFDLNRHQTILRNNMLNADETNTEQVEDIVYQFDANGNAVGVQETDITTASYYEDMLLIHQARYQNDETQSVVGNFTVSSTTPSWQMDLSTLSSLPISNLMGVKMHVDQASACSFQVKVTITTTQLDGTINTESTEQTYHVKRSQWIVLPIRINRDMKQTLKVEITSDSTDFSYESLKSLQLIRLQEGKCYQYNEHKCLTQEQDGYNTTLYQDFNEHDIPLTKVERNIYGEEVITHYHYDAKEQLTYVEDSKQNVTEYAYDAKGNCTEKRSYNKKDASLMKVEKTSFDEQGKPIAKEGMIRDENGKYPKEEITYFAGTRTPSKVKGVNGESICYQYDRNQDHLLSISSSIQGINNATSFTYRYGLLTSMSHHGVIVDYEYDGQGRKTATYLNHEFIASTEYQDHLNLLNPSFYPHEIKDGNYMNIIATNGLDATYYRDAKDQLLYADIGSDDENQGITYLYDDKEQLIETNATMEYRDGSPSNQESLYNTYDAFGQVIKQEKKVNQVSQVVLENHYDQTNRFVEASDVKLPTQGVAMRYENTYDEDHQLQAVTVKEIKGGTTKPLSETTFDYDVLGRVKHQNLHCNQVDLCHEYAYLQQDENTLDYIAKDTMKIKIQNQDQTTYLTETSLYTYDVNGNITSIEQDQQKTRYFYDGLNRLIREDNPIMKKSYVYQYDEAGNILSKKAYTYNIISPELPSKPTVNEYIYDCEKRDQLIAVNGKMISYDKAGRPIVYKDQSMTWNGFDQLIQVGDNIQYAYDINGIRKKKVVQGVTTEFTTNGSQILSMKHGDTTFIFRYVLNTIVGFNYNDNVVSKEYLYLRNIQGDIIGIYDDEGNQVGEYAYDGYGNQVIIKDEGGIASLNPFRYRGYFFDEETGFYYLSARYYDPETGRFISPDTLSILDETKGQINGLNLYMYCADNPIMNVDPSGHFPILAIILGLVALTGMGLTIGGVATDNNLMTAIGLTMVAIPALISGGMGLACFGAWGTMAVGGITALAGIGTGIFASAEYQEAFTGRNWIMDTTGMSDKLYNGLMLSIAAIATAGTITSMVGVTRYHNFGNSNWLNGWREMRHHYLKHGMKEMKFGNIYKYTNSARNIITNGNYIAQRNAYAMLLNGHKVAFVGVGHGNKLIATYYYKTLTIKKLIEYGLIVL